MCLRGFSAWVDPEITSKLWTPPWCFNSSILFYISARKKNWVQCPFKTCLINCLASCIGRVPYIFEHSWYCKSEVCPNCSKFGTALPQVLIHKPAKCEVARLNGSPDMQSQTDIDSLLYKQTKHVCLMNIVTFDMLLILPTMYLSHWVTLQQQIVLSPVIFIGMNNMVQRKLWVSKRSSQKCLIWTNRLFLIQLQTQF